MGKKKSSKAKKKTAKRSVPAEPSLKRYFNTNLVGRRIEVGGLKGEVIAVAFNHDTSNHFLGFRVYFFDEVETKVKMIFVNNISDIT